MNLSIKIRQRIDLSIILFTPYSHPLQSEDRIIFLFPIKQRIPLCIIIFALSHSLKTTSYPYSQTPKSITNQADNTSLHYRIRTLFSLKTASYPYSQTPLPLLPTTLHLWLPLPSVVLVTSKPEPAGSTEWVESKFTLNILATGHLVWAFSNLPKSIILI